MDIPRKEKGKPQFYDLEIHIILPGISPLQIFFNSQDFLKNVFLSFSSIICFSQDIRCHHWKRGLMGRI